MTTDTRTYRSALVGWCRGCDTISEPYKKGETCPFTCVRQSPVYRRLTKRRMLICEHDDELGSPFPCLMGFPTRATAEAHECYSAY